MSEKELEIFNLCQRLAELLGDKEAIADLKELYDRHPEMFKDMQEVSHTIKEVVSEPEIIKENPKAKNDKDFMLYKQLDNKKMADVGIRNDDGTNIIFHTNKKNVSKSNYFKKNKQMLVETPSAKAAPTRSDHCADKSRDLSRDSKVLSTSATSIIPQNQIQSQAMNKLDETISKLDEAMAEQSARVSQPEPNYEEQENIKENNENLKNSYNQNSNKKFNKRRPQ